MGAEIRKPITRRLAPHQPRLTHPHQHLDRTRFPAPQGRWGLYPGEPRGLPPPGAAVCPNHGAARLAGGPSSNATESRGELFWLFASLALLALPVHYLAHYRWKKPLFVAVSIVGLFWVFGSEVGSVVLGLAALLIGICFLPISFSHAPPAASRWWPRCLPAHGQALVFAVVPSTVWPVLATMFMFRMLIYMYELKHAGDRKA